MEKSDSTNLKENCLLQDGQLKKINVELEDESSCCTKSEPGYIALDQSHLKGGVANSLLFFLKSGSNKLTNRSNETVHNENVQCKEMHPIKENAVIKTECKVECSELPEADLNGDTSLGVRLKLEVKSFDLNEEENDDVIGSHRLRKVRKSNDLFEDNDEGEVDNRFKFVETRLDKIPRDILVKYGFVLDDSDVWRDSPTLEGRLNVWNDDFEEGRLIIDENEEPVRDTGSPQSELSEYETDFSDVSISTKESTAGFTNCGHHLVISSVTSLQWSERCTICEMQLPIGYSLELHKKGHCSFPGCLDFIQDDYERQKHFEVHKGHPTKPFRCEFCRKRFHYYRFTKKHRKFCKVMKRSKCPLSPNDMYF